MSEIQIMDKLRELKNEVSNLKDEVIKLNCKVEAVSYEIRIALDKIKTGDVDGTKK